MNPETHSVTLRRVFDAPIELVWAAWTRAEHLSRWMKCDREATYEVLSWTPEVGGRIETRMIMPGQFEVTSTGRFTEVDPPRLLAYTIDADPALEAPEMRVRVQLAEVVDEGRKTQVTLTQSGIPTDLRGIIDGGWTHSLSQLGDVVGTLVAQYSGRTPAGRPQPATETEPTP